MMNIVEIQDRLKDFSNDQLMASMQNPTGEAPQYLVLSELSRRQRMQSAFEKQANKQQSTVAEDLLSANGVPKQGLAALSNMAANTDMAANDGVAGNEQSYTPKGIPPQPVAEGYADGGLVVRNGMIVPGGLDRSSELGMYLAGLDSGEDPRVNLPAGQDVRPLTNMPMQPFAQAPAAPQVPSVGPAPEFDARAPLVEGLPTEPYQPRFTTGLSPAITSEAARNDINNVWTRSDPGGKQAMIAERLAQIEGFRGPMVGVPDRYRNPDVTTVMDDPIVAAAPPPHSNRSGVNWLSLMGAPTYPMTSKDAPPPPPERSPVGPVSGPAGGPPPDVGGEPSAAEPTAKPDEKPTPPARRGGGSGGGSGKSGGQIAAMLEELAKERKINAWLALAKAGAALASSRAPSLGSALGEAAGVGLDALTEGNSKNSEKKRQLQLAQMQFEARRAAAAGSGSADPLSGLSFKDRMRFVEDLGIDELKLMLALNASNPKDPMTELSDGQRQALVELINERNAKARKLLGSVFDYSATQPATQ